MQSTLDMNLLVALDVLLEEGSVGGAAQRLHLSAPAMSRTLGRIRKALGDPVLVRSGRDMVPTPRALAIHAEVRELVERAHRVFRPEELDVAELDRVFTVVLDESMLPVFGTRLLHAMRGTAPNVRLRFLVEGPQDSLGLRKGSVDLEIGVIGERAPDVRVEPLFTDRFLGVVRAGHPLLHTGLTAADFAAAEHLNVTRRGRLAGPVDTALAALGLTRRVAVTAPTFTSALFLLRDCDLVGHLGDRMHRDLALDLGLATFDIPLELPPVEIAMAWHACYDADAAHSWLRDQVRASWTTSNPTAHAPNSRNANTPDGSRRADAASLTR